MGFYFNTFRQQHGDQAYNEGNYEEALKHYGEALKTLNLHAASKVFLHIDYYDALVYVLSEILSTKLMIIRREAQDSNFKAVSKYWQGIPSMLCEMELIHEEHLSGLSYPYSNKDQVIVGVHKTLAAVCEDVSDELADSLDEEEDTPLEQNMLPLAIEWMRLAISFQLKTQNKPKLSSSLGFLNLLELQYKKEGNTDSLQEMSDYIKNHKLLEMTIESSLKKLELLSYVIRVALVHHKNIDALTLECQTLYATLGEEDIENPIVEDLQELISLVPEKIQDEMGDLLEEPEADKIDEPNEICVPADMEKEIEASMDYAPEFLEGDTIPEGDAIPETVENPAPGFPDFSSASSHKVSTRLSLSSVCASVSPNPFGVVSQHGFFAPTTSPSTSSIDELAHGRAFELALTTIIKDSSNPKFLANLLCLIADHFSIFKVQGIQKRNAIVIAFDLYHQVIKIHATHDRAIDKIKNLFTVHRALLEPYQSFSHAPPSPVLQNITLSETKALFSDAIGELTTQLESLLMNDKAKLQNTINNLIDFIGKQLDIGTITGIPCPEIKKLLVKTYNGELGDSVPPGISTMNI
ncbi:hypothetical protein OQJ18_01345 [Fluoribacter dumoffii]|uniref:hypothetical protein n=1 Tax=Fluoribacter dumoffii TaxID=463 RepID=UPI002242E33A|nr:hypothetical protein [Fluoribacter dumoffii]MCW8419237.1 hypothetical protein [Fluoribacter dumoffii]MCW8452888.1 hypothetical protein [Fluoribacter dumoffii]MCW8459862.1 hypothetical protein [Fluoribacter dumoffii]MCW8483339.1 hypothetical protein [Fluoribacter dumoffii]